MIKINFKNIDLFRGDYIFCNGSKNRTPKLHEIKQFKVHLTRQSCFDVYGVKFCGSYLLLSFLNYLFCLILFHKKIRKKLKPVKKFTTFFRKKRISPAQAANMAKVATTPKAPSIAKARWNSMFHKTSDNSATTRQKTCNAAPSLSQALRPG